MAADTPVPLATPAQMRQGPLGDLVRSYTDEALMDLMVEATRACETECQRRLVPFTNLPETHRAEGIDPDELANTTAMPLDLAGTLGRSYASAIGVTDMVRHVWLNQYAPVFPEMWSYTDIRIVIDRSIGGQETVPVTNVRGPDPDTGHVWFQLGTFLPVGSWIRFLYSGGYHAIPADLVRAGRYMAAGIAAREIDPMHNAGQHDSTQLTSEAVSWLTAYTRS